MVGPQELADSKRAEEAKWQLIETEQQLLRAQREQLQVRFQAQEMGSREAILISSECKLSALQYHHLFQ